MDSIEVIVSNNERKKYIDNLLHIDHLSHIVEDSRAAYCPISLTQTPEEIKPFVKERQNILLTVLKKAGLTGYDPYTAPYSPDTNLTSLPNEVYQVDSAKIVGARYFVGHNLTASTGFGVELEKATKFNRLAVILYDKKIRISRMQPHRIIYLEYESFEKQQSDFISVFQLLQEYEPGIGFHNTMPVLLGFKGKEIVDLEELMYKTFPHLAYRYNGAMPTLTLKAENPELFYEHKRA